MCAVKEYDRRYALKRLSHEPGSFDILCFANVYQQIPVLVEASFRRKRVNCYPLSKLVGYAKKSVWWMPWH